MKLIACLLALEMSSAGDTVLREANRAGMRQKGMAVGADSFTETYIERLARAELARKPRVNFIQLYVYGGRGGAPLPKPSHVTYDYWRGLYGSLAQSPNEIAEMISIGSDAVLRMHDDADKIHRRVLAGKDPLQIEVQGDRFEILYFAFSAPGPYILQRADVYIRTDAPLRTDTGLELLRKLQPVFPEFEVSIFIRNDPWFIYEPTYPFVNPFIENPNPPTTEEYGKGQSLKCRRLSGSPSCELE
jgi:hypothetical protein